MKKLLITFSLLMVSLSALRAQGTMEGGVFAEQSFFGSRVQQMYGLSFYLPVRNKFTLNWNLGIGPQTKGGIYAHAPAGLVTGVWLLSQFGGVDRRVMNAAGVLLAVLPEGVGLYLNEEGRFRHHLSFNLLGMDYWYRQNPYNEVGKLSATIQYRLKALLREDLNFFISPTAGVTMIYNPENRISRWGIRLGVCIGLMKEKQ
ncbi:MAG: hypothetical protein MUC87_18650 [Bacteroidia bacterium]|nr:hypothetical protein [Bacteroidia bacterium]